jgi:hypothetical protein
MTIVARSITLLIVVMAEGEHGARALAALRDALLAKLVSNQLRVAQPTKSRSHEKRQLLSWF